jgi:molybdenum cofactor guanylyltransferase
MAEAAAIILTGGRSSRMGSPKAALDWHGSTLLRRVTGLLARVVDGPIIVVRAPGQDLLDVADGAELVADAREGYGPMQGIAAGLATLGGRAPVAHVSSTDVPLLHPAFVRRVIDGFDSEVDVVLPEVGGYRQPLAAAYRGDLLATVEELIAAERVRPAFLFERCRVRRLDGQTMLKDLSLARFDPDLASVSNLNEPADYERAHALPVPSEVLDRGAPQNQ